MSEQLLEAIDAALHELGVPGSEYPTPVANAVAILQAARSEYVDDVQIAEEWAAYAGTPAVRSRTPAVRSRTS